MNKKDLRVVSYLRQDARMPLTKISRKTHIPVSTIFDRLKSSEESIIVKHTSLLDFTKLGFHTRANVVLKVDRDDKEILKEFLLKNQSVNSVSRINNGFDFMAECIFRQIVDLEEFLDNLEQKFRIADKKTYFIIEDLKKEAFMSDPLFIN